MENALPLLKTLWPKYLSGTCTREEMETLLQLLAQLPESEELEYALKSVEQSLQQAWQHPFKPDVLSVSPDWSELWQGIENKTLPQKAVYRIQRYWPAVAALFVLAAAIYWFRISNEMIIPSKEIASAPEQISYPSSQNKIYLPDGSLVILLGNAQIHQDQFNERSRIVSLEGEAFFDVKHDASRPFIVKANHVNVRVLGTAFLVSALPGKKVEVKVTRGRVQVSTEKEVLGIITPAQSIAYNDTNEEFTINRHIDTTGIIEPVRSVEWKWRDVKLEEVLAWLNVHFNVEISVSDKNIAQTFITASFQEPVKLEDVLEVIGNLYHMKVKQLSARSFELTANPS